MTLTWLPSHLEHIVLAIVPCTLLQPVTQSGLVTVSATTLPICGHGRQTEKFEGLQLLRLLWWVELTCSLLYLLQELLGTWKAASARVVGRNILIEGAYECFVLTQLIFEAQNGIPGCHRGLGLALAIVLKQSAHLFFLCGFQIVRSLAKHHANIATDRTIVLWEQLA